MITKEQAQTAIKDSKGCLTCLAVMGIFECGCCKVKKNAHQEYVGGVWLKGDNKELKEHFLICRECFEKFS